MNRTRLLFGLFVLLAMGAALVTAVLDPTPDTVLEDPRMSTDNAQPRGARAVYLWSRELGHVARSLREPLASLSSSHQVLFLLEPAQQPAPSDLAALFAWVSAGGVLVVSPGFGGALFDSVAARVEFVNDETDADEVPGDRVVSDEGEPWRYREMAPDDRGMFAYPVEEVAFLGRRRVADPTGEHSILFARDGLGIVAELYEGDGAILVLPERDLLTNRGIAKADNVDLVASLLEDWVPEGATIWFDDFDQGLRLAGSLEVFLARRRPGLFALALLAAGWLAVLRYGRALTTRPEPIHTRRRPAEFVDALGSLYARSRAITPAWRALAKTAERVLAGTFPGTGSRAVPTSEWDRRRAQIQAALTLGRHASRRDERDLLRLARAIASTMSASPRGRRARTEE